MDHNYIDKILSEKETFGFLVCGYQINAEDVDIFSCLIFEYLDPNNYYAPTGIVYVASIPMFCGLKLALLMLCILSSLLLFHGHSWICLHLHHQSTKIDCVSAFQYVNPDNKFDNEEFPINKEFVSKVYNNVFATAILTRNLACNMTRMEMSVTFWGSWS